MFSVRVVWVDDKCDGKEALGRLVDVHSQLRIDAVVGLPCSSGQCLPVSNPIPHIHFGGSKSNWILFKKSPFISETVRDRPMVTQER